jgi:hypothetical protein
VEGKALFAEERSDCGSNTMQATSRVAFARRMLLVPRLLGSDIARARRGTIFRSFAFGVTEVRLRV